MGRHRTDEDERDGDGERGTGPRRRSTVGGTPTVTDRGDDRATAVDRWGQRTVTILLVVVPAVLVGGLVAGVAGGGAGATAAAAALLGVVLAVTALLALAVLAWRALAGDRQATLAEFRTYEK